MSPQKRQAEVDGEDVASEGSEGSRHEKEGEVEVEAGASEGEEEEKAMEVEEEVEEDEGDEEMKAEEDEDAAKVEDDEEDEDEEEADRQRQLRDDESCGAEDREGESSSSPSAAAASEDNEFIVVKLADIRKEVQCPICLGIIKKTRTVMECLHRFCRDCIDKSMRLGNNECPACRTHCASRRSLRDDPNYDSLIAALYPDIEKYEEEELTFREEERALYNKIQLSIAATLRRQAEALGGKRRVTRNMPKGRNRSRMGQCSDDDDGINGNNWERDSTAAEEHCIDVRPKRYKRPRPSRSTIASDADDGCDVNEDGDRETRSASPGRTGNREMLVWGKGGTRSQTRHGGGANGKNIKGSRISKMVDYLRSYAKNDELDVHLSLLPLGDGPNLDRPHLCCRPNLTIRHICQFIAHQTSMNAEQIEILARKLHRHSPQLDPATRTSEEEYQLLEEDQLVDGLFACYSSSLGNLVLVYRVKIHGEEKYNP